MIDMEFVLIQPGTFLMGSPETEFGRYDDETQHKVTISRPFYMQTTPVTQGQWQEVMRENPSSFKGENLPVDNVSWNDAQAFIAKLNAQGEEKYRLPTEAEWEYACRAGTKTPFGIGNGHDLDSSQANFDGNYPYGKAKKSLYRGHTTPVKNFTPNAWGLYDMHGNVWEWCQDWYSYCLGEVVSDPQGPFSGLFRVIRGGSWYGKASAARSAYRSYYSSVIRYALLGFRLVKEKEVE